MEQPSHDLYDELGEELRALISGLVLNKEIHFVKFSELVAPLLDPDELEFIGEHINTIVEEVSGLSFSDEKHIGEIRRILAKIDENEGEG